MDEKRIGRIGEKNNANNGLSMTVIGYQNKDDIDIQFEDGVIVSKCHPLLGWGCYSIMKPF